MRVPMPDNPLGYTLVYILESARGPVLVDAGWDAEVGWKALTAGLAAAGTSVTEVYGVLATHHHFDHAGLAGRVREASGAWVAMHELDATILRRMAEAGEQHGLSRRSSRRAELLAKSGASEEVIAQVEQRGRPAPALPAIPDRTLADRELMDVPGSRVRAIWTPGHTPGHTCFWLAEAGKLLSGDHVLPVITPHIGLFPGDGGNSDPLGDYLGSLARVADLPSTEVLPAHQHRFPGLRRRTTQIAQHHEDRLRQVLDDLADGPKTLWHIAQRMQWNTAWDRMSPHMWAMAIAEAGAHIRRLERLGQVITLPGEEPLRFALGTSPPSPQEHDQVEQ